MHFSDGVLVISRQMHSATTFGQTPTLEIQSSVTRKTPSPGLRLPNLTPAASVSAPSLPGSVQPLSPDDMHIKEPPSKKSVLLIK